MLNIRTYAVVVSLLSMVDFTLADPALTLSAPSLPSDFNGVLVHSITGISPGETVPLERFADLNENGEIDDGEPLMRLSFISDGTRPIIGGVVNRNVAGDDDAAVVGAIRVDLEFPGPDTFLARQTGKFLIRLTTESGEDTKPFKVRQPDLPQGVSGKVRNGADHSPIPFATIIVAVPAGGDYVPVASVRSDAEGAYHLNIRPGTYVLGALPDGFVAALATATVAAGQTVTKDLFATPGTTPVSGTVADAEGEGLPTVAVFCQSSEDSHPRLFAFGLTDAYGNYEMSVTAGAWRVRPAAESIAQLGYLMEDSGALITATSSPLSIDLLATKATSLIYGRVSNTSNTAIPNVGVFAFPNFASGLEAAGQSLGNGDYFLGVSGGSWDYETFGALVPGFRDVYDLTLSVGSGAAVRSDIILSRITTHLRGRVVDESGTGIEGVFFSGQFESDDDTSSGQFTGPDGSFEIPVWAGNWSLHVVDESKEIIDHREFISIVEGVDQTMTFTVPDPTGHIHGTVSISAFQPIVGAPLKAVANIGGVDYESHAISDKFGAYRLPAINGVWGISIDCNFLADLNLQCAAARSVTVMDDDPTLNLTVLKGDTTPHLIGRVLDADGVGLPGVPLNASSYSGEFRNARSGPNGEFNIAISAGQWTLHATVAAPPGRVAPFMSFTAIEGKNIRDIRYQYLSADATISGTLNTSTGLPVPGVLIFGYAFTENIQYSIQARTDLEGHFAIPALNGLTWSVNVSCGDFGGWKLTCPGEQWITPGPIARSLRFVVYEIDLLDRPVLGSLRIDFAHSNILLEIYGKPGRFDIFGTPSLSTPWTRIATLTIPPGGSSLRVSFNNLNYHFYRAEMRAEP